MNKYSAYMVVDAEVKPIWRELFLIVAMSGCPKITVMMACDLKGTEVEEVIKELSIEYEQVIEIIYKDSKVEQFMFGVYHEDNIIDFTETKEMIKFLMLEENQIRHDEKCIRRHKYRLQGTPYSYQARNSKKDSVKYKQYKKNLTR